MKNDPMCVVCYERGKQDAQEGVVTVSALFEFMESDAVGLTVSAVVVLAVRFVAGWAGFEPVALASVLVFVAAAAAAATGWSLRLWRWARRGQSINRLGVEGGGEP